MGHLRTTLGVVVGFSLLSVAGVRAQEPGATGSGQSMSPGCMKIVAVLDESGGGLSADEVAKKTNTDVETVRSCTDKWREMKGKAKP
jgi:hypothetical protein